MDKKTIIVLSITLLFLIGGLILILTVFNSDVEESSKNTNGEDNVVFIPDKDEDVKESTVNKDIGSKETNNDDKEDGELEDNNSEEDENKDLESNFDLIEEDGNKIAVSKRGNASIVVGNKDTNKVTYGEVEKVSNNDIISKNLQDVGKKIGSSNEVNTDNMNHNKYSEAVEEIYKENLNLKVIPNGNDGFFVFKDGFRNVFSNQEKVFYYSSFSEYDETTIEVIKALELDLTEKQIKDAMEETRRTGKGVNVGKYQFKHGGSQSALRWW